MDSSLRAKFFRKILGRRAAGVAIFFMFSLSSASAFTALSGKDISMKNPIIDDVYAVGSQVDIDQPVTGDVTVVGGIVNITEDVTGDVLVLGGRVNISGNVSDDVRVFGGSVTISGNIKDDLIVVAGSVELSRTGSVGGSVMTRGGLVSIDGNVTENVTGSATIMKVKGWISGNVDVEASEYLSVSPSAKIRGDLRYFSKNPAVISDGTVSGKTELRAPSYEPYKKLILGYYSVGMLIVKAWNLLALLILGMILFALFPQEFAKRPEMMKKSFWKSLGIGFLGITAGVAFILFCAVTVVGLPLALILGFGGGVLWYISQLIVALFFGNALLKFKQRSARRTYGVMVLGLFVYTLISLIPVAGLVVNFIFLLAAFGVMLRRQHEWIMVLRGKR